MNSDFREYLSRVPVVDTHEHYSDYRKPKGMPVVEWLNSGVYWNVVMPMPSGEDDRERYNSMCAMYPLMKHTGIGRNLTRKLDLIGISLLPENYEAFRSYIDAYDPAAEPGIAQIEHTICNTVAHPSFGLYRVKDFLAGKCVYPTGMHQLFCISGYTCPHRWKDACDIGELVGMPVDTLPEYLAAVRRILELAKTAGAVGYKDVYLYFRPQEISLPDKAKAERDWESFKLGGTPSVPVFDYLMFEVYAMLEELGLPVAIHTGCTITSCEAARHLYSLGNVIAAYPKLQFDLYHLNYPLLEDYMTLIKSYPNTIADGAWLCQSDGNYTLDFFRKALAMLPCDRVAAFGGDSFSAGVTVAASLSIAEDIIAEALRDVPRTDAELIANYWLSGTEKQLFRL